MAESTPEDQAAMMDIAHGKDAARESKNQVANMPPMAQGAAGVVRGLQQSLMSLGNSIPIPGMDRKLVKDSTMAETDERWKDFDLNKGVAGKIGVVAGKGLTYVGAPGAVAGKTALKVAPHLTKTLAKHAVKKATKKVPKNVKELKKAYEKYNKKKQEDELGITEGNRIREEVQRLLEQGFLG